MFKILSDELISKIIGCGYIHYGPYSLWISCGNPDKRLPLYGGKHENTFDIKKLYILSQVNKEFRDKCIPILLDIKNWYLLNRRVSDKLIKPLRDLPSPRKGDLEQQKKRKIIRHLLSMYDKSITDPSFMKAFDK